VLAWELGGEQRLLDGLRRIKGDEKGLVDGGCPMGKDIPLEPSVIDLVGGVVWFCVLDEEATPCGW
jgi:hypothetical protein